MFLGRNNWIGLYSYKPKGGFSPSLLSGLQLWYDAADAATITQSVGAVSQWNDKSGNNRNATQAVGANQPAYGASALQSGKPGLDFTSSKWMAFPVFSFGDYDAFVVTKATAGATDRFFVCTSSSNNFQVVRMDNLDHPNTFPPPGIGTDVWNVTTPSLINFSRTGTTLNPYLNNVLGTPFSSGSTTFSPDGLGIVIAAVTQCPAVMSEVLLYNRTLTAGERTQVYNYLKAKWNTP